VGVISMGFASAWEEFPVNGKQYLAADLLVKILDGQIEFVDDRDLSDPYDRSSGGGHFIHRSEARTAGFRKVVGLTMAAGLLSAQTAFAGMRVVGAKNSPVFGEMVQHQIILKISLGTVSFPSPWYPDKLYPYVSLLEKNPDFFLALGVAAGVILLTLAIRKIESPAMGSGRKKPRSEMRSEGSLAGKLGRLRELADGVALHQISASSIEAVGNNRVARIQDEATLLLLDISN
jgi:hypothetical protein